MAEYDGEIRVGVNVDTSGMSKLQLEMDKAIHRVESLQRQVEAIGKAKTPTQEYKQLNTVLSQMQIKLQKLVAQQNQMPEGIEWTRRWTELNDTIADTSDEIDEIKAKMQSLDDSGKAFTLGSDTNAYADKLDQLSDAEAQVQMLKDKQDELAESEQEDGEAGAMEFGELGSTIMATTGEFSAAIGIITKFFRDWGKQVKELEANMKKLAAAAVNMFKQITSRVEEFVKSTAHIKNGTNILDEFSNRVLGLAKRVFVFSIITRAFRAMVTGIGDSFNAMTQYNSDLDSSVSGLVNALNNLRNALVSAFAPVLNVCIPQITTLINYITAAVDKIGQLIAAISGKSSYTRLISNNKDWAASIDKVGSSAKKAQSQLAGFDELDVRKDDSSSGSGSGGGAASGTEEVPIDSQIGDLGKKIRDAIQAGDWEGLGRELALQLANMLMSIPWDDIQARAAELGKHLAELLNGVFETLELAEALGHTIAQALNTALIFAYNFLTTFDFLQFGVFIGTMLNTAIAEFNWQMLADTIDAAINGVFTSLYGFITTFDFSSFGRDIGDTLYKALVGIDWGGIASVIVRGADGINQALLNFTAGFDFSAIAQKIVDGMNEIITGMDIRNGQVYDIWAQNGTAVGKMIDDFVGGIFTIVSQLDYTTLGEDLARWFNSAIEAIDWTRVGATLKDGINGLLDLAISFIDNLNWDEIISDINSALAGLDWPAIKTKIGELVSDVITHIGDVMDSTGLGATVGDILSTIATIALELWIAKTKEEISIKLQEIKSFVMDFLTTLFGSGVANYVQGAVELVLGIEQMLVDGIAAVIDWIQNAVTLVLSINDFLWNSLVVGITTEFTLIMTIISGILTTIHTIWTTGWNGIKTVCTDVWTGIKTVVNTSMTAVHDSISKAMTTVKKVWADVWEGMKTVAKGAVNGIISIINGMISALEEAINLPLKGIDAAISKLPIKPAGWSGAPQVTLGRIPYLADGAVLHGGNPFMAILGDQPSGQTNIEAPISTIREAVRDELENMDTGGVQSATVVLELDGNEVGRTFLPILKNEESRIGTNLQVQGAMA